METTCEHHPKTLRVLASIHGLVCACCLLPGLILRAYSFSAQSYMVSPSYFLLPTISKPLVKFIACPCLSASPPNSKLALCQSQGLDNPPTGQATGLLSLRILGYESSSGRTRHTWDIKSSPRLNALQSTGRIESPLAGDLRLGITQDRSN